MKTYKGTLKKNDLEGGFWELVTEDGERYQIKGADETLLVEGQKVSVNGEIDKNLFGIGMVGSYLKIDSIEVEP